MMKKNLKYLLALLCIIVLLLCTGCSSNNAAPQPISITVWTYYNGTLLESFNTLVKTFNETVGKEKGIIVEAYSQGSVNELEASVMQSAEGKVGAAAMPNIFSAYADTAYALDKLGLVVDVSSYLTADERAAYVDNYLTEGDFGQTGSIKIFPVAKSTELLFLNETDWQPFAEATGTQESEMLTIEGLLAVAERYYNWTDAQTATPDDGKALFGRDAMANYLLIGAQELGCTIFEVDGDGRLTLHFDRDIIRKLWDSYYVPFIKGYFSAAGRFRSDDIKTGNLLCYVGSSSSGTFFPSRVITSDTESHDITLKVLPCPKFADGESFAVQQGAGMVVTAADEAKVRASVEFLKWFTLPENDISFSVGSGYMPVTKAANNMNTIKAAGLTLSPVVEQVLTERLGDVGKKLHTARSRNDQVALDTRLYLRDEIVEIIDGIRNLQRALLGQAETNKRTILPGFTHLQHAQPVLFAHHLLAYVEQFERDIGRLTDCRTRLNVMPLGSGALAGSTLPIDREFVRKALDFPTCTRNSMDSVADRDFACELLAALAIFSMHISRLSEDIILWMSQEFRFVELSDAFCTGSSLMPQKKNPDIAEISRGKTGRMYGNLTAMLTICKGLPMTYNRDLQEDKEPLFDSIDTAKGILSVYPAMIATMKTRPERMLEAASDPGLMATDLAEALVRKGVPFRHAHHKVGALVRYCAEHGKEMNALSVEEMKSVIPEADESMLELFSPVSAVTLRKSYGGTGYEQVASQLAFWKEKLGE